MTKTKKKYSSKKTYIGGENMKNIVTIVTAYIEIISKHKKKSYMKWLKSLCTYNDPMVIFIENKNIEQIKLFRKNKPTQFILTNINKLSTRKYLSKLNHENGWYYATNMHKIMDLDDYSSINLEKPNFLKIAKDMNFFNTDYYFWCDAGFVRYNEQLPKNWPNINISILNNHIITFSLKNNKCTQKPKPIKHSYYTYDDPPKDVLIMGGLFAIHRKFIDLFHNLFYTKLDELVKNEEWGGMDQYIYSYIACENPSLFKIIKANNNWFYGLDYFNNKIK